MNCVIGHSVCKKATPPKCDGELILRRSVGAVEELRNPGPDGLAVVAVHHGAGHPDRIPEEEVLVQRLPAGETGDRGVKGQLEQPDALGPVSDLPCRYISMSARASLLTSASPGSAISPDAENFRMICGKRWATFGYQLRAAFSVDHFGSMTPASLSSASASEARTSARPISTSIISSAMSSWMCWNPSMPIDSASSMPGPGRTRSWRWCG